MIHPIARGRHFADKLENFLYFAVTHALAKYKRSYDMLALRFGGEGYLCVLWPRRLRLSPKRQKLLCGSRAEAENRAF